MQGNVCVAGWVASKLLADIYAVFEFVVHYLVHMVAFIFLYGKVIRLSSKVLKRQDDTTSEATQKVTW